MAKNNADRSAPTRTAHESPEREESLATVATPPTIAERNPVHFPIVGIGASAGGLAAFEAFFSAMPADIDPGMAFVIVQHLAPDHKSILTELIRHYTRMAVCEVEDGMLVHPNCAYIIPPNRDMALIGGSLQLLEPIAPRGQRLPIDYFFTSLAQDRRELAFCVVLSGTGTDGTLGLRAIKAEGGLALAQNVESAEFDGMPRSAIATGLVDYALPPAEMPAKLIAYAARAVLNPPRASETAAAALDGAFKKLFLLLRAQTGHDFSQYKPSTIERRIRRRMAIQQIESVDEYVKFTQHSADEVDALFSDFLIGVTGFFRDPDAFAALDEKVIRILLEEKVADAPIRVWVPSCSTGEEAYSIAILMAERQSAMKLSYQVQIFATDIDAKAIGAARTGVYPAGISADVAPDRLARYFSTVSESTAYRINKSVREMVIFSVQDIIKDPPFSRLDLISCRNLLIYMGSELQKKVIPLFHYALNPGGFLFLGTSETIGEFDDLYLIEDRKQKIFRRRNASSGAKRVALSKFLPSSTVSAAPLIRSPNNSSGIVKTSLRDLTEQSLLLEIAPAAVLVEGNGDILYQHGRTGMFLEPAPGMPGASNVIKMAREGLQRRLASALREAATGNTTVRVRKLRVKTNGDFTPVDLTVCPVERRPDEANGRTLYLIVLASSMVDESDTTDEPPRDAHTEGETERAAATDSPDRLVMELRLELRAKEEYLQALNEEMEASNEDLKSSNEEMQSMNEELQSTNEELETSKEELQSVNEELSTINAELHTKMVDLSRANNDMNNLLAGTGIGTIFVDHDLRVVRFTPAATSVINLIQSDIGRPLGHIVYNLKDYHTLLEDTRSVLDTLIPRSREVLSNDGAWYIIRILPYRTLDNVIEGAVLTFVDTSETKKAKDSLLEATALMAEYATQYRLAEAIVSTVREPLLVLDSDLKVVMANRSFCLVFGVSAEDTKGRSFDGIGGSQLDIGELRNLLERILTHDETVTDYRVDYDIDQGSHRALSINARRMFSADGDYKMILMAIDDVTDTRNA